MSQSVPIIAAKSPAKAVLEVDKGYCGCRCGKSKSRAFCDGSVATAVTIGPRAAKPLQLDIPLFVSGMSSGALSEGAKTSLARGHPISQGFAMPT